MTTVKQGDTVKVHYVGRLSDGTEFDNSYGREPLEFVLGDGDLIPGFELAVAGMRAGQKKTVVIPAEEAYGSYDEDMLLEMTPDMFPGDFELSVGLELQLEDDDGNCFDAVVTDIQGDVIMLDANHPLAGRDLTFDIEVIDVQPA